MALSKIVRDSLNTGIDDNSDATAITIDSSETVLVGKTATNYQTVGVEAKANGSLWGTADGNNPLILVRKSSDGAVAQFYKDSTNVGSIGAVGTDVYLSSPSGNDAGVRLGNNIIRPCTTTGGSRDNAIDLGKSDTRFKDLYLGGNLYIGGTGSANGLSDYEEGTWTPTIGGSSGTGTVSYSTQLGTYTKIGRVVTFHGQITASSTVSGGSGTLQIAGLPFASSASPMNWYANANLSYFGGLNSYGTETDFVLLLGPTASSTFLRFHAFVNRGDISRSPTQAQILSGSSFYFGGSYETTL